MTYVVDVLAFIGALVVAVFAIDFCRAVVFFYKLRRIMRKEIGPEATRELMRSPNLQAMVREARKQHVSPENAAGAVVRLHRVQQAAKAAGGMVYASHEIAPPSREVH